MMTFAAACPSFFTLPLVGRVDRPQAGRGGGNSDCRQRSHKPHSPPSRLAALADLPHKGGGEKRVQAGRVKTEAVE